MLQNIKHSPFKINISFLPLKKKIEADLPTIKNEGIKKQYEWMLELFVKYPELTKGFETSEELMRFQPQIEELMAFIFPNTLTDNEIKAAFAPLLGVPFYFSNRLKKISKNIKENISEEFYKIFLNADKTLNFLLYSAILNMHYHYPIEFGRALFLKSNDENGVEKTYRITINADFMDIVPNENAIEITEDILGELLSNPNNVEIWNTYFPKESWTICGFGLLTLHDITTEEHINNFKTHLIQSGGDVVNFRDIVNDIRTIFGVRDLAIGGLNIDECEVFSGDDGLFISSILPPETRLDASEHFNTVISEAILKENKEIIISNVSAFVEEHGETYFTKKLQESNIESLFLIPIWVDKEPVFILEVASKKKYQLNDFNFSKLKNVLPYLQSFATRSKNEFDNTISAIIQREYTSIHSSVEWRFQEEAQTAFHKYALGEMPSFQEITFKKVYPLYGQIDIVESSNSRNIAIYEDLKTQLSISKSILENLHTESKMPIYEQLIFKINYYESEIREHFNTNTEQEISQFFTNQIFPVFEHEQTSKPNSEIRQFLKSLDEKHHSIYHSRKNYDKTVDLINKELSQFLDIQQEKAQKMFPHYFEKYKTDGIEHNMYIGQSLVQKEPFHISYLHNLRLWQLQVMCEMEALYYEKQKDFPQPLNVASLVFAYDIPINIRYRTDEKKFDVDGAYNVRYEIIKKRIDKAYLKNTNERLTQAHKLCVVYSTKTMEREYLQYFEFLQSKNYIGEKIEIVELEELQGATGLKAIRAELNHEIKSSDKTFTVNDFETFDLS